MSSDSAAPRYFMHKYWGKKPASGISPLVDRYTRPGDTILDPFSGYGVFCCEAYLKNRNVIVNDLNPIANFIAQNLFSKDIKISAVKKMGKDKKRVYETSNDMKKLGLSLIISLLMFLPSNAQGVSTLNNYFNTYAHNIKTNNFFSPKTYVSCIYDTHYMTASQLGKMLTLDFGYGWDEKYGYIHKCELKIDLSSATFYTGFWTREYTGKGKWEHYGKKEEITIEDNNGMDLTYTGEQNYNRGTKQNIISKIVISFGSEPLANRVLNELYSIQSPYKGKEPWLLPQPEPEQQKVETPPSSQKKVESKSTGTKKAKSSNNIKGTAEKKYGKYGQ